MYIFYDTETSGLERDFSQILQIGLVFTDDDLNILSTKKVDCRRSPWVLPSPGALLTTGFTPDDLKNSKNSNFEMMQEVDQWVRAQHWPVIFAGYNTLGYDEAVMAQNFHMNLLEPRLTEAENTATKQRNSRFDVMTMVQAVQAYMPGALTLKIMNEADPPAPSLKLSNVAAQNGVKLGAEEAHDAMNDIKATVGVAKVCKKAAPALWDHMHKLATLDGVNEFMSKHAVFTQTAYEFGRMNPIVATNVCTRGSRSEILFDLSQDPTPYLAMTADQLKDALVKQDKKPPKGAPKPAKPFRFVRKDLQPIIMPLEDSDPVLPKGFDDKLAASRAAAIKANPQFAANLRAAALALEKEYNAPDPKAAPHIPQPEELIDRQASPALKKRLDSWMEDFRAATSWRQAAKLVEDFYTRFEKDLETEPDIRRYVKFAGRIVFEHAPEELSPEKQELMKRYVAAHILSDDPKAPWMTIAKARKDLDDIEKSRADGKKKWADVSETQIRSLKLYYTALEKEYAPYLKRHTKGKPVNDGGTTPPANAAPSSTPPVPPSAPSSNPPPAAPPAANDSAPGDAKPAPKKSANDAFKP
jgi:exodeoxyribonuclease-1